MRKIIYTDPAGMLWVVTPRFHRPSDPEVTEKEAEARARAALPADAIDPEMVDAGVIPTDRTFRNAWVKGGVGVTHDMEKCRAIHRDRLRDMRKPLLQCLDIEYQRADEEGSMAKKQAITQKKKLLRDVTADPAIDAAESPEELKGVIPEALL